MAQKPKGRTLQLRVDGPYLRRFGIVANAKEETEAGLLREATDAIMLEADVDELIAEANQRHEALIASLEKFREWQQRERTRRISAQ